MFRNDSLIVFSKKVRRGSSEREQDSAIAKRIGKLLFGEKALVREAERGFQYRIGTDAQQEFWLDRLFVMPGTLNPLPPGRLYYRLMIRFPKRRQFTKLRARLRSRLGLRLGRQVMQRPAK